MAMVFSWRCKKFHLFLIPQVGQCGFDDLGASRLGRDNRQGRDDGQ